jgi:hypothetical protein
MYSALAYSSGALIPAAEQNLRLLWERLAEQAQPC